MAIEVFETMTGRPRLPVQAASAPWTRRITGNGSCQFVFKLDDWRMPDRSRVPGATIDALFKERARSIAIHDGNDVAYSGIIMATDYDDDSATLTVETHEARIYARWRMLAGVNNITAADLKRDGLSAAAAVGFLVERTTGWTGWEMPFDFTTSGTGNISIDNDWYDFRYVEDLFAEIEARGYEIDMHPIRTAAGWFRWQFRVAARVTSGNAINLSSTARRGVLSGLKVKTSGVDQATGVLALGKGEGTDKVTAWAGDPTAEGIPVSDVLREAGDVRTKARLQGFADAQWADARKRIEQWSFALRLKDPGAPLSLGQVLPGRRFRISVRNNRRLPDSDYEHRVIALSGDQNLRNVRPEVQRW